MDRSHNDRRRAPAKRGKRRLASHGPAISGLCDGRGTPFISPGAGAPTALGPVPPFDSPVSSSPTNAIFRYPASREEVHHAHQFAVSNGAVSAQTDALLAIMAGVLIEDSLQHFAVRSIVADLERQVALDGKEHGLARSRLRLSIGHGQFDRHVDGGERCRHHEYDEQHQDHVDEAVTLISEISAISPSCGSLRVTAIYCYSAGRSAALRKARSGPTGRTLEFSA